MKTPATLKSLAVKAYLRHIGATGYPVVLGPWRSELGFEALYWMPFLTWAMKYAGISPDRCVALSRGGMGWFYPAAKRVDLYQLRTVDQVRLENGVDRQARGILKQMDVTAWDRQLCAEAVEQQFPGTKQYHILHPSWMYWLLEEFWEERQSVRWVAKHTEFSALPQPNLPEGMGPLPNGFVAVRVYERATLPLHDQAIKQMTAMVQQIASRVPVILLNQGGLFADDHTDLNITGPNIFALPQTPPHENLLLQAAVLSRAQAFVGTYGGVAQWALRYGKASLSVYEQFAGTAMAHKYLSQVLAQQLGIPFETCDLRASGLWTAMWTKVVQPVEQKEAVTA